MFTCIDCKTDSTSGVSTYSTVNQDMNNKLSITNTKYAVMKRVRMCGL